MDDLMTTREVRKTLGMTRHGFDDLVERVGLEPARRIGLCRMWTTADVERLREAREAERAAKFTRAMDSI